VRVGRTYFSGQVKTGVKRLGYLPACTHSLFTPHLVQRAQA
jgi:hypothetical protein